jgi:hypothetical protein
MQGVHPKIVSECLEHARIESILSAFSGSLLPPFRVSGGGQTGTAFEAKFGASNVQMGAGNTGNQTP